VKLENDFDTDVCFQPFPDLKGITMPYVVVPIKAEIPVFFNNATNEFISLKTGSALGVGIEVEETQVWEWLKTNISVKVIFKFHCTLNCGHRRDSDSLI
jgi:hypothetical protein